MFSQSFFADSLVNNRQTVLSNYNSRVDCRVKEQMKYNYSYYNIVLKETEEYVHLYNSYSGALCKLEKKAHDFILNSVLDDKNKCKYFDDLLKQGFIKPIELNEYNKIVCTERTTVLSTSAVSMSYVIAPTLACNLNCDYCFESGYRNNSTMSDDLLFEIADYIYYRTDATTKNIHVVWFGGEPLVAFDKIVKFSKYLISKLTEKQINFSSTMISNGLLFTEDRIKIMLKQCALKSVQITIDGTKEIYCARKHATSKQFDELFENIKAAVKHLKVSVRLNCDDNNYDDLKTVAKQLIELCREHNNLNIYLAKLVDYSGCGGEQFFSQDAFDNKRIEFDKYICELQGKPYKPFIPKYRKTFCGLFKLNSQVIGPNGEIYKCEHHIGQTDKVVGNIKYGLNYNDFLIDFIANTPPSKCRTCKIFPICLGGCPAQRFDLPHDNPCCYTEAYIKKSLLKFIN